MYCLLTLGIVYRTAAITLNLSAYAISLFPLAHIDSYALGSLLAISTKERKRKQHATIMIGLLGLMGILLSIFVVSIGNNCNFVNAYYMMSSSNNYLNNYISGNIYLFISLFSFSVIRLLIYVEETHEIDNKHIKFFAFLGDESYNLYLFHWPVLYIINHLINNVYCNFFITLVLSIFCSFLFKKAFRLISIKKGD